jgi:hypothetical protein
MLYEQILEYLLFFDKVMVPPNAVPGTLIHVEFQSAPQEGLLIFS